MGEGKCPTLPSFPPLNIFALAPSGDAVASSPPHGERIARFGLFLWLTSWQSVLLAICWQAQAREYLLLAVYGLLLYRMLALYVATIGANPLR